MHDAGQRLLASARALRLRDGHLYAVSGLAACSWLAAAGLLGFAAAGSPSRPLLLAALGALALLLLSAVAAGVALASRLEQPQAPQPDHALPPRDELTGLHTRGYFQERVDEEFQRAQRYGRGFAVLLLDVDGLQIVNDSCGQSRGDEILRSIGGALRTRVRAGDVAARLDGDGFGVLLAEAGETEAIRTAERVGAGAAEGAGEALCSGGMVPLSLSYGLATYAVEVRSSRALLQVAEQSLHAMKREKHRRSRHLKA